MKKRLVRYALLAYLFLAKGITYAYEVSTHEEFSKYATERSILKNDPTLLSDLGLSQYGVAELTTSDGKIRDILSVIRFGSRFEDDGGSFFQFINPYRTHRFFRHFFDPQSGSGLTALGRTFPSSPEIHGDKKYSACLDD